MNERSPRLLIAHVVYRFDVGGLENGVVNLINRLPADRYRHAVIALTEVTDFRRRILRDDVQYIELHKGPGHGIRQWPALWRIFRDLRPDIVHTRNLAPLEAVLPAWLAGVPGRVHGEHGWDIGDLEGANVRNRLTRRLYRPFVTRYVALSQHLRQYLQQDVGIAPNSIAHIYNGVDTDRFAPSATGRSRIDGSPFTQPNDWVVGTVGRLSPVKNQAALVRACARLCSEDGEARARLRLAIVGDGPAAAQLQELARSAGIADRTWFAGARDDVALVLRGFDAFALPSLAEGISNTLLEAMATALPVVATAVGGNAELLAHDTSGMLVPADDDAALAEALRRYLAAPDLARQHGQAARRVVTERFSLDRMVADYSGLYESIATRPSQARIRGTDGVGTAQAGGNH